MPTIWFTGSPTKVNMKNETSATMNITRMDCAKRRITKASIQESPERDEAGLVPYRFRTGPSGSDYFTLT